MRRRKIPLPDVRVAVKSGEKGIEKLMGAPIYLRKKKTRARKENPRAHRLDPIAGNVQLSSFKKIRKADVSGEKERLIYKL